MIPDYLHKQQHWQTELADLISDPAELLQLLELPTTLLPPALSAAAGFALRVPRAFVHRMRKGDAQDPLLLQVLPLHAELHATPGFSLDPLAEQQTKPVNGILHKYHGRLLLMLTGACAIHCRYCFRRHFPYQEHTPRRDDWSAMLDYLRSHTELTEVILSGGDPLVLSDRRLAELVAALNDIPHLKRLRIHSRLPVVLPSRLDDELLAVLGTCRLQQILVIHANHAQELDASVARAVARCRAAGITVLNQAVLLRGINDSVAALAELSETLFSQGVLPYYLHVLDRVQGAGHFEVTEETALHLHRQLLHTLPGYLVPRLVREIGGEASKTPLFPRTNDFV